MAISMKGQAAWGLHDRWRDEARGQGRHGDCRRGKPCVCVCVCVCETPAAVSATPRAPQADRQGEPVAPTEGPGGAWQASTGL